MYAGSYQQSISGTSILGGIALFLALATMFILPIVMACKFQCKNKILIIVLHIVLSFVGIGSIVSSVMIAMDKKKSPFYEDTGKNIARLHIVLYALSIIALFTPMAKARYLDSYLFDGVTSINLISCLTSGDLYVSIITWITIIILISGFIVNLIFRDARKLIGFNTIVQGINAIMMMSFIAGFENEMSVPGMAFVLEGLITIVFVISLFVATYQTSYVDN